MHKESFYLYQYSVFVYVLRVGQVMNSNRDEENSE